MAGTHLLAYLGVVTMITLTPGPDTALVLRNGVRSGVGQGLRTAAGCASGLMVWGLAAGVGIAGIAATSSAALELLRMAGMFYLVFVGLIFLRRSLRGEPVSTPKHVLRRISPFWQGMLNDLLNPKALAFFTALLPQFVPENAAVPATTLLLGAIAASASFVGLATYALLAGRVARLLRGSRLSRIIDGATGAVMVSLGIRTALTEGL